MASKKRDGGGSNLGLIITLVFFVLSTVILGITTYLSYAELEKKETEKKTAVDGAKKKEAEALWHRFKANALLAYLGEGKPTGVTPAELAEFKKQLDQNTLTFASALPEDTAAFKAVVADLDKTMKWQNTDAPAATVRSRFAAADQNAVALGKMLADARRQQAEEKTRADQARDDADKAKATFDAQIKALTKQRQDDLVTIGETNARLQKELDTANADKNLAKTKEADVTGAVSKAEADKKKLDADLRAANKRVRDAEEERNELRDKVTFLKEKTGVDEKTLESSQLDRNALEALRGWSKDWRIVDMDRTGKSPYINLGTSDRVQPQLTFSVHDMGKDGRLNPIPKGTVEVVRTSGAKLSQARVTSVKDAAANPILKGDYLFNPTWDPSSKTKVAVAGVVDLNEDRTDGTAEFLRLLARQNVEVDAAIDLRDDKAPRLTGGGITARTKYVVMADTLDQVNHPKAKDKVYREAYEALVRQMRDKASANAVPVISLRRYLDMIGYRSPKATGRAAER